MSTSEDVFTTTADGLKIHARLFGRANNSTLPVVCIPGLTRTTDDFIEVAQALATDAASPRRVIAIDLRGRGLSDYDPNPANYAVPVEMGDVLAVLAAQKVSRAIFLGTSRGGIITIAMAATNPKIIAGAILNDIGPVLEMTGLLKIKGYISDPPARKTYEEAARGLKELFAPVFPSLSDAQWMAWARRAFKPHGDGLVRTYDNRIADGFAAIDADTKLPPMWDAFDALKGTSLMVIHGLLSDLLSDATVAGMGRRHGAMELVQVADEGHAPLLADAPTIGRIKAFCAACDQRPAA